jgi:hypothetical protein
MKLSFLERNYSNLGQRYYGVSLAHNLLKGFRGINIVQSGVQSRLSEHSDFDVFDMHADLINGKKKMKYFIFHEREDLENEKLASRISRKIYSDYLSCSDRIFIGDTQSYNNHIIKGEIDLLILNDIHFPIRELVKKVCIKNINYLEGRNILNSISIDEMNKKYKDIINPCQRNMLEEYEIFKNSMSKRSVVLLEGNDYPGGSQTFLVKKQLESDGYICLLDIKQSIWLRV